MSAPGKNAPVVLAALLVLGTAAHFVIKGRLEKQIAAQTTERSQHLRELRENRRLLQLAKPIEAATETPAPTEAQSKVGQMNAATELLKTGFFGPFAWTRGQNNSITDEVAELADALELNAAQKAEMRGAAEKAEREVVAAVLASAKVQLHENSVRSPAVTREEEAEWSRQYEGASPLREMEISAQRQSRQAASRGEREVSIEIPASPEARAAFDAMQASFAQIMGSDVFAFYQAAGASRAIESMFDELGLQPHWLSLISRPAGNVSVLSPFVVDTNPRGSGATANRPAPPSVAPPAPATPANQLGVVYEFHRLRSLVTMPSSVMRSNNNGAGRGGSGGGDPLTGIIPTSGVSGGSSQAMTGDALRSAMGPLQSLIPVGFVP